MEVFSFGQSTILIFVTFSLYLSLYILFLPFEYFYPAEIGHTFSGRLRNVLVTLTFLLMGALLADWLLSYISVGKVNDVDLLSFWNIAVTIFYIFLIDFFYYWYHRAEHAFSWLWPVHELHHSDRELNITTSYRTYWLERPLQALLVGIPAGLVIGDVGIAIAYAVLILTVWEFFTHANLRLHLGVMSRVICGPQVHRIHHSRLPQHQNKNFAQYFPIIDVLFGTYYAPKQGEFPPTGLDAVDSRISVGAAFLRPFMLWAKAEK